MLRFGLVGLGDAGRHHARALRDLADLGEIAFAAICAPSEDRALRFHGALQLGPETRYFASMDDVLARCDVVVLATPDGLHAEQVLRCAAAGRHVLCEKPLAFSHAEGRHVADKAWEAGIALGVGYHLRHHAGHAMLHDRLEELVGPLRSVDVRWAWPDPAALGWRSRSRAWSMAALGTHALDLILWFAGSEVEGCSRLLAGSFGGESAEVSLRLRGGVMAHASVCVTHRARQRFLLVGERGEAECLDTLGARGAGEIWLHRPRQQPEKMSFERRDPYRTQIRAFAQKIAAGEHASCADALANLKIMDEVLS